MACGCRGNKSSTPAQGARVARGVGVSRQAAPDVQPPPPASGAFRLKDAFALPTSNGWPIRVGKKVVNAYSFRNAMDLARQHGIASTPEGVQALICEELRALGRGGACQGAPGIPEHPYVEQDKALLASGRGPVLKPGTFGADSVAWASLHLRALDGILDTGYLDFFERRVSCQTCQRHWNELIAKNPFTPGAAFQWAVLMHNLVNEKLGVAKITVEDARWIWSQKRS